MITYKNGNTIVHIEEDGTKIRYIPDGQEPSPEFPESIDIKITNRCDMGCPMCHEESVPDGKLANLNHPLLKSIPAGVELALGGGNPLEHPSLVPFLEEMKERGVICNMTVHYDHFVKYKSFLRVLTEEKLIHGLGISLSKKPDEEQLSAIQTYFPNAVIHVIAGIISEDVLKLLFDRNLKILILGYKFFGRGVGYADGKTDKIKSNIDSLSKFIKEHAGRFAAISFDNLAIYQLSVRKFFNSDAEWNQFYMGDDGMFTMYVDLVENKFAISSINERKDIFSDDIRDLFSACRKTAKGQDKHDEIWSTCYAELRS